MADAFTDQQLIDAGRAYMAAACSSTVSAAVAAMRAALSEQALSEQATSVAPAAPAVQQPQQTDPENDPPAREASDWAPPAIHDSDGSVAALAADPATPAPAPVPAMLVGPRHEVVQQCPDQECAYAKNCTRPVGCMSRYYVRAAAAPAAPVPAAPTLEAWERFQAEGNPMHTHAVVIVPQSAALAAIAAIQARPAPAPMPAAPTYSSTQATNCAGCGKHKHTPLRIDAMGGYVCLTCIDQKLGSLLGEFGYPEPSAREALPWISAHDRQPDYDEHRRVLVLTADDDFAGVQVHDIPARDFYSHDPDAPNDIGTEVTRVATHWMWRDEAWPATDISRNAAC